MIKIKHGDETHTVPCGKCGFCLMNKRSQWMFRVYHEMRNQEYPGWFITLTYDERHVRRTADGRLSLRFRDVQLYFKKLRKAKYHAKYICVGEYGGQTHRPHYHMLLWTDCPVELLESFWTSSKDGSQMGRFHLGRISMASAMYTLKYIIQPKQKREDVHGPDESIIDEVEPTRAQFSKGIGLAYLSRAVYEYHTFDYDSPNFMGVVDGNEVALPRYYKYKIFTKYQLRKEAHRVKWQSIRERRKLMRELKAKGIQNTFTYIQELRAENARRIIKKTKFNQTI